MIDLPKLPVFWYPDFDKDGSVKGWKIEPIKFIEFIYSLNFRRFDFNMDFYFVRILQNVIEEIPIVTIQDEVVHSIKTIKLPVPEKGEKQITREQLISKFYSAPAYFFNKSKLSLLGTQYNLVFNSDTKEVCHIYYKNGYLKCTSDDYTLMEYETLEGFIFKKQITQREFQKGTEKGNFNQFIFNIANKDEARFLSLKTMIGYLCHSFYDCKRKAVVLTDTTISDVAEGRTGKSIVGYAIMQVKNFCELNGKDFDPLNKHKYSEANIDSQGFFLNDAKKGFKIESLYNDITDHATVDKKNQQPFKILGKYLISANDTFQTLGASTKDRIYEFELSEHYGENFSPLDEFGKWFFSNEWDNAEWQKFDNFIAGCICEYLKQGVIEAESINLDRKKQIQQTNPDFVEWMDEMLRTEKVYPYDWIDKKYLHEDFLKKYPEYNQPKSSLFKQRNFTKFLEIYCRYSKELKHGSKSRKTNSRTEIMFCPKNYNPTSEKTEVGINKTKQLEAKFY